MYIATQNESTAVKDYFNYYFYGLKVGLVMGIQSGMFLLSGIGKSYGGLKVGEILDEDFSIKKVIFTAEDFLRAIELIEEIGKPSQVLLIDEGGILINAKKWYRLINRGIADTVMTFRDLKCLAVVVSPTVMIIDKDIRIFVSHLLTTRKGIKRGRIKVNGRLYTLSWGTEGRRYYKRRIRMYLRDQKKVVEFKDFDVGLPSKKLTKKYEKRIVPYKRRIRRSIKGMEMEEKPLTWYVENFLEEHKNKIHETTKGLVVYNEELRDLYDIPFSKARAISRIIKERLENEG